MSRSAGTWSTTAHHSRLKYSPAAGRIFQLPPSNRSTCGVRPYIRATCNPDADSWVADFLSWWIDPESGHPIRERAGVLRYFSMEWFEAQKKNG